MKKTILLFLVLIFTIVLLRTLVFADEDRNMEQNNILTKDKLSSIEDTYVEIDYGISTMSLQNEEKNLNLANQYVDELEIPDVEFTENDSEIKEYDNALYQRKETVISNEEAIITINSETDELITYINNNTQFIEGNYSKGVVKEKAIDIFSRIDEINPNDYELTYIEQFDSEIWRVGFSKKYGEMLNDGESVNFSFCPATNEIVTLAINRLTYANNETNISIETAENIAKKYLDMSVAENMTITLDIVRPNYFYKELQGDSSIYKKVNEARKAYIVSFNNESQSKVYIDATTGEVIGGNMILGGEY